MLKRQSDPSNQLPWQRPREGGRDEGRVVEGSQWRRQLEGGGEVGAGMWQLLTLKHEREEDCFLYRYDALCACLHVAYVCGNMFENLNNGCTMEENETHAFTIHSNTVRYIDCLHYYEMVKV